MMYNIEVIDLQYAIQDLWFQNSAGGQPVVDYGKPFLSIILQILEDNIWKYKPG